MHVASEVGREQVAGEDGKGPQVQTTLGTSVSKLGKKRKSTKRSDGQKYKLDKKPMDRKTRKLKDTIGDTESQADVTIVKPALDATEDGVEQQVKVKKQRKRKEKPDRQTQLTQAKVTKPGVNGSPTALKAFKYPAGQKYAILVSENFPSKCTIGNPEQSVTVTDPAHNLALEPAVRRSILWTPTRDTEATIPVIHSDRPPVNPEFAVLRKSFGFTEDVATVDKPAVIRNKNGESLAKRRRIEVCTEHNRRHG